jgi:hypothetical protein
VAQISKLGVTRSFRSAVVHAIDYRANCPATMAAVDCLTEKYISPNHMLDLLWNDPRALEFGCMYALGIEYSPAKQSAVFVLTGRTWADWLAYYYAGA